MYIHIHDNYAFFLVLAKREDEFSEYLSSRASFRGFTALHYAVLSDNEELITLLLAHGADPTLENDRGHPPSSYARTPEVRQILEKHTSKVSGVYYENVNALQMKIKYGRNEVCIAINKFIHSNNRFYNFKHCIC